MEAGLTILVLLTFVIGVLIGRYAFGKNAKSDERSGGIIHVAYSEPDSEPDMFLTLTVPVEDVVSRKQVVLDVHVIR